MQQCRGGMAVCGKQKLRMGEVFVFLFTTFSMEIQLFTNFQTHN
jgi:hypothetical protein